ncbi:hypothetical protein Pmi06nite_33870 [Planotetraspora mira]|uniref:Uncharacterized protein n=1 Tax=Planotetraspora mira TaxID=58121 RepID=A0A8J3X6V5_9ACTN|nr:hypothetical protein Pmi06nite_33870 [Planotetraspora mira]
MPDAGTGMPFAGVIVPSTTLNCEAGAALAVPERPAAATAAPAIAAMTADLVLLKRIVEFLHARHPLLGTWMLSKIRYGT